MWQEWGRHRERITVLGMHGRSWDTPNLPQAKAVQAVTELVWKSCVLLQPNIVPRHLPAPTNTVRAPLISNAHVKIERLALKMLWEVMERGGAVQGRLWCPHLPML